MSDSFDFGDFGSDPAGPSPQTPSPDVSQPPPQSSPSPDLTQGGGGGNAAPPTNVDTNLGQPTAPQTGGKQGFFGTVTDWLSQPSNLLKLGLGAGGLGLGLASSSQAQSQGAAAQQQIANIPQNLQALSTATQQQLQDLATKYQAMVNNSSSAIQGMAQPIMQQYTALITATNNGQLTPANQQIMDAARARIAQDAANRGGVGAEQSQAQLDRLNQTLLAGQMQQAMQMYQTASPAAITAQETQLSGTQGANQYLTQGMQTALSTTGLTDQYALNAIQTGLQQDQQARQSMQNFYSALAQILAGGAIKAVAQ